MKQKQTSIILGTHGEDYGSWMSTPVFYIVGGIMLLAVLLTILSFFVFHIAILGVLFSLITGVIWNKKCWKQEGAMKTMRQEGILNWIYSYALKELFNSDLRSMALELRIGEGVIQRAMDQEKSAESMLLFEQLMRYCMQHDISMDSILAEYSGERRA